MNQPENVDGHHAGMADGTEYVDGEQSSDTAWGTTAPISVPPPADWLAPAGPGPVEQPVEFGVPDAGAASPPAPQASNTSVPPYQDPCFEYLGDWILCENAGDPNFVDLARASLPECLEQCLETPGCTAVTDYTWLELPNLRFTCGLYTSTCDAPTSPVWAEEDGERQYRLTCPHP